AGRLGSPGGRGAQTNLRTNMENGLCVRASATKRLFKEDWVAGGSHRSPGRPGGSVCVAPDTPARPASAGGAGPQGGGGKKGSPAMRRCQERARPSFLSARSTRRVRL